MSWLASILGSKTVREPSTARTVDLPGLGLVRIASVADCVGAMCPRPPLLTMKMLGLIEDGEIIEVVSDNPAAVESFPSLTDILSCTYLMTLRDEDVWRIYLRKGLDPSPVQ